MIPVVEMQRLIARTEELVSRSSADSGPAQLELRELLNRNRELMIELMRENEQLRVQNLLLEKQKLEADQRLDASRLGIENQQLKAELELLNTRLADVEKKTQKFRRRYEDVEKYNMALSNVYIASNQLHSTLDFSSVVKTAEEILWNLIASPVYAIFLKNEKTGEMTLVGGAGIEGRFANDVLPIGEGMISQSIAEGVSLFIDGETTGDPLACIPLRIEGRGVVGLITVYEIEQHKGGLSDLDKELFDLLASQTATAMFSSRTYSETERKLRSMESFINLMKPQQ
jgi:hypothetical protein